MTFISKRRLVSLVSASAMVATMAVAAAPAATFAAKPTTPSGTPSYHNGFEKAGDTAAGAKYDTDGTKMFAVTRVAETAAFSAASGRYYAKAAHEPYAESTSGPFTRYGGYNSAFPVNGYTTSVDFYLDMSRNTAVDTDLRFDWSSAISSPSGAHRRDFIFHVGTNPAATGEFVVSASNNAPGWPANPALSPLTISESGWYTFKHDFKSVDGVLVVEMRVLDADGTVLGTWTRTTSTDIIGETVGGNRYGWLVTNDFENLAIDNITRVSN